MPSGSNTRVRRTSPKDWPAALASSTPSTEAPGVVHPPLARLCHQRQRAESRDPGVRIGLQRRVRRAESGQAKLLCGDLDWPWGRRREHVENGTEPEREGQQVPGRDGAAGRHGIVERPVHLAQHPPAGQLGQQPVDRLVQPDQPLVHKSQGGHPGNRLRCGRDPEQRVTRNGRPADRQPPERLDVNLVSDRHQRDQARHVVVGNMRRRRRTQPDQPIVS
jgi:hypothetical protein